MHFRITHKSFILALVVVLLVGFSSPAMAVGCDCLCCGLASDGHHPNQSYRMNAGQAAPFDESHGSGCKHCTLTPLDSPEAAVSLPSLLSKHTEKQVRLAAVVASPIFADFNKTENDSEPYFLRRSAPIYLQTLVLRR